MIIPFSITVVGIQNDLRSTIKTWHTVILGRSTVGKLSMKENIQSQLPIQAVRHHFYGMAS
jgi:hypothetical protein